MRRIPIALLLFIFSAATAHSAALEGKIIAVDPGHGTVDFHGRVINTGKYTRDQKTWEHQLTLNMAVLLGEQLEKEGARVVYTRTPYDYWRQAYDIADDNKARGMLANEMNADAYISIHCDWDSRSRIHGVTTYYRTAESEKMGKLVHQELVKSLRAKNRHLRKDTFTVLEEAQMPALLLETGFLSNRREAKNLQDPKYQTKIAVAISAGLRSYFEQYLRNP